MDRHLIRSWVARALLIIGAVWLLALIKFPYLLTGSARLSVEDIKPFDYVNNLSLIPIQRWFMWSLTVLLIIPSFMVLVFTHESHLICPIFLMASLIIHTNMYDQTITISNTNLKPRTLPPAYMEFVSSWCTVVFVSLVENYCFYLTGHQPTIAGIPWDAAFAAYVGEHQTRLIPAFMVLMHLFSGSVLVALSLPLYVLRSQKYMTGPDRSNLDGLIIDLDQLAWRFFCTKCLLTSGCVLSTGLLRRHLMVWKIFAPRLIYSICSLFITGFFLCVNRLIIINSRSKLILSR